MDPAIKIKSLQFIMRISNNIHNIAMLDVAEMMQEYTAEEQVPVGNDKFKTEKVQKKTTTPLKYVNSSYALAPKTR